MMSQNDLNYLLNLKDGGDRIVNYDALDDLCKNIKNDIPMHILDEIIGSVIFYLKLSEFSKNIKKQILKRLLFLVIVISIQIWLLWNLFYDAS